MDLVTLISVDLRKGFFSLHALLSKISTNLSSFLFVPHTPPFSSTLRTFDFVNVRMLER